ncbi:MAG TPA: tetratricopeptide repeat protein, partial [Polyangiales bacterium]
SSVPQPTPSSASAPPPRLSDKTQPLRLDQILQVAGARKAVSVPPAKPESVRPEPPPQALVSRATVAGPAAPPASFGKSTVMGFAAPPPVEAPSPVQPLFSALDQAPEEPTPEAEAGMFEPAPAAPAPVPASPMKATLLGMGSAQNSMDATLERELPRPQQALATAPVAQSESLRPSGRPPLRDPSFDANDETASMASSSFSSRLFERRGAMYVGAALVGVGVLAVLASALFSRDPAPVANRPSEPQPVAAAPVAPPVPTVQPVPTVSAAEPVAAKPTVEALAPAVVAQPAPAASTPPPATRVEAAAPREEPKVEPREESKHHHRHRELAAASAKSSRHEQAAPKERSKSAKTAVADKSDDKTALFTAARDDARNAYATKNYKAAAAAYERAAKLDPKHAGTFAGLGSARLQLGENKAAVAAYQHAVQLSPETSGFHAALGRAYLANGERAKAVASYKKALSLDPKNEAARAALAQLGG